jgi:restriction endonuclease S subunit
MTMEESVFDSFSFPKHWKKEKLRWVVENRKFHALEQLPLLGANITLGVTERFEGDGRPAASEDLSKYKLVEPGDIVMNPLGKPHGSIGRSEVRGITSPAYWVLRTDQNKYDSKFMHYLLRSEVMLNEYKRRSKNLPPNQFDLPWDQFREMEIFFPEVAQQRLIAMHLDQQIAVVDTLIEKKNVELDQVGYFFDAVVRERILGIGVNENPPPLWANRLGQNRRLIPLGNLVRIRGEKNDPIKINQVLSLTASRGVILYEDKGAVGNIASDDISRYSIVRKNDLVVNCMNVIIGSVGLSKYEGVLSPVYYVLMPVNENSVDMEYLALHFRIREFQRQLIKIGYGILDHRMRIPWINLKAEKIIVPSFEEQRQLVLELKTLDVDRITAISAIEKSISVLQEYKSTLVTSLVTGSFPLPFDRSAA